MSGLRSFLPPLSLTPSSDDHHRAVLHVELQLLSSGEGSQYPPVKIDVMTTHMRSVPRLSFFTSSLS
jgi:hypothetical protein